MVQVGDLVAPAGDRGGRRRQAPQAIFPPNRGRGAAMVQVGDLVAPAGDRGGRRRRKVLVRRLRRLASGGQASAPGGVQPNAGRHLSLLKRFHVEDHCHMFSPKLIKKTTCAG